MSEINETFLSQLGQTENDYNIELSDDEEEETDLIENFIEKDVFKIYHPQIKQINNQELQSLIKINRNDKGLIDDENHKTLPILTRYEKAKIIGLRAKQINAGSDLFINAPDNIIDGITLAKMELDNKKIPFIIRRPLPDGTNEYWDINDLDIME
jgi:DNA-directed RNA polymerase subunit K/omega